LIVNQVELRNFISHRNTSLSFDLGVTAIVGPNGAGKTSILDAISYSLFKVHSRGREEYVVNRGEKEASVRLTFTSGGRRFLIEWNIEKGKRTRGRLYELYGEEKKLLIADGEKAIVPEVEKILEIDRDLFLQAVYVRQGEIESLVEAKPAERKRMMARLLGIEDLEEAWDRMREVIEVQRTRLAWLEAEVKKMDETRSKLKELERKVGGAENDYKMLEGKVVEAKVKSEGLKAILKKLDEEKAKFEELEREKLKVRGDIALASLDVERIEKELKKLEQAYRRLEEVREGYEAYQKNSAKLEELQVKAAKLEGLERQVNLIEERIRGVEDRLKTVQRRLTDKLRQYSGLLGVEATSEDLPSLKWEVLDRLRRTKTHLEEERVRARREVEKLGGRLGEVERLLEELTLSPEQCPICGRQLTIEHFSRITLNLRKEAEELKDKVKVAQHEAERLEAEVKKVERLIIEVEAIDLSEVEELSDEALSLNNELERLRQEKERYVDEVKGLRSDLEELNEVKRKVEKLKPFYEAYLEAQGVIRASIDKWELERKLGVKRAERDALKDRLRQVEEELNRLSYNPAVHDRLKGEVEEAERKLTLLESQAASRKAEVETLRKLIEEIKGELQELEAKRAELERRRRFVELLEKVRRCFSKDGLQRVIRARAKPLIERCAKEYLEKFNLEYSDLKLDEDFNPTVLGPLGEQPIETISGGERVAIAIALRLAIARALAGPRLELMMLDEPTVHLDDERRRELVEVLKKFFREGPRILPQLILVTHDREVEEAADTVYLVARERGYSRVRSEEAYPTAM